MGIVRVFDKGATDFTSMGLCVLDPISCVVRERLNGSYTLEMEHPLDGARSAWLVEENIIVAPVPAGKSPAVGSTASPSAPRLIYRIYTSTNERLRLRKGPSFSSQILGAYNKGKEVTVLDTSNSDWFKVVAPDGAKGYMYADNLVYVRTESSTVEAPTVEPHATRPQPFRIYEIIPDMETVHVRARHIFYDLSDNLILSYKQKNITGSVALPSLLAAADDPHDFVGYSDLTDTADAADIEVKRKSPPDAILGDGGLIDTYGGELFRDWYDIYVVRQLGGSSGVAVMYGLNLLQVGGSINTDKLATRIVPVGSTKDGKDLYLPEKYVESPHAANYHHARYYPLDVKEAKIGDEMTQEQAFSKMRKAANDLFASGVDGLDISLTVDFVQLENTVEYATFAPLLYIHPFDTLDFHHSKMNLNYVLRMTEYGYDALGETYVDMTLGSVQKSIESVSISPKLLDPRSISGVKIIRESVDSACLGDAVVVARTVAAAAIAAEHLEAVSVSAFTIEAVTAKIDEIVTENLITDALYAAIAEIAQLAVDNADIKNLTAANIQAGSITAELIAAKTITAGQLAAGLITAESGLIANGAIVTAMIGNAQIVAAHIQSIDADVITTGTLSVQRLLLVGEGGVVHEINAQAGGLTSTQLTEEQYQHQLAGSVIVARSITAAQIAAGTITGNEILANSIKAANIDVADLFAATATINALKTVVVKGVEDGASFVFGKNRINVETPLLSIVATGSEDGQEVARFDKDGGHFRDVSVDGRIDCDMVAWRYAGPASYTNVTSLVSVLDALNHCYLDYDVTITLASGLGNINGAIEFAGIRGPGHITVNGNTASAPGGVKITACTADITFNALYAAYTRVRSPYCHFVNCSATGSYTASGTQTSSANPTRTKAGGATWWSTTDYMWQGYTESSGRLYAAMWFPGLTSLASANILAATVRLKRVSNSGKGDDIEVRAYTATNTGPSGTFSGLVSRGLLGVIKPNEVKTFALPPAAAAVLCAGGCLVLDPGDTTIWSDKTYSSNYAKFYGVGTGCAPILTVTYEIAGQVVTKQSTFIYEDAVDPEWVNLTVLAGTTPGSFGNGALRYRKAGNRVSIAGGINIAWSASVKICDLPYKPKYSNQYYLQACSGGNIARVYVHADGYLQIEWVRDIANGTNQTSFNSWVDLNLDYWTD